MCIRDRSHSALKCNISALLRHGPDHAQRFELCEALRRQLFLGTGVVFAHPAEFIQLRLQMVYFALPVAQLFLQGVDQRFLLDVYKRQAQYR